MTAISGETGAGKSIMVDALSLCLGGRTDAASFVTWKKADISATFEISVSAIQHWLEERDLENGSDPLCILRRVISKGRLKVYINGRPCNWATWKKLAALSTFMVKNINLYYARAQRQQLDEYG